MPIQKTDFKRVQDKVTRDKLIHIQSQLETVCRAVERRPTTKTTTINNQISGGDYRLFTTRNIPSPHQQKREEARFSGVFSSEFSSYRVIFKDLEFTVDSGDNQAVNFHFLTDEAEVISFSEGSVGGSYSWTERSWLPQGRSMVNHFNSNFVTGNARFLGVPNGALLGKQEKFRDAAGEMLFIGMRDTEINRTMHLNATWGSSTGISGSGGFTPLVRFGNTIKEISLEKRLGTLLGYTGKIGGFMLSLINPGEFTSGTFNFYGIK